MSENQKELLYIFITTCSLSVFMSSLVTIMYFKYGAVTKNFPAQLIMAMSILDVLVWFPRIISSIYKLQTGENLEEGERNICIIFGFTFIFFSLITFFITLMISFGIYSSVVHKIIIANHKKTCIFIIIILPLIFSTIPFTTNSYGEIDDIKCSITNYFERVTTFFVVLWIIFFLNAFFIISTIVKLKRPPYKEESVQRIVYKIALFPLFMFVSWAPSSIYRILQSDNLFLGVLTYLLVPLQGVFNPIAYGLINEKIEKIAKKIFCCNHPQYNETLMKIDSITLDESFIN